MEEPTPLGHRMRPLRGAQDEGAVALRRELDAAHAALAQETHRRQTAQAAWEQELRRHEATAAALAQEIRRRVAAEAAATTAQVHSRAVDAAAQEVARGAREVLGAKPAVAAGGSHTPEPVWRRLEAVLEVLSAPAGASGSDATREDLATRFELVRAQLRGEAPGRS